MHANIPTHTSIKIYFLTNEISFFRNRTRIAHRRWFARWFSNFIFAICLSRARQSRSFISELLTDFPNDARCRTYDNIFTRPNIINSIIKFISYRSSIGNSRPWLIALLNCSRKRKFAMRCWKKSAGFSRTCVVFRHAFCVERIFSV